MVLLIYKQEYNPSVGECFGISGDLLTNAGWWIGLLMNTSVMGRPRCDLLMSKGVDFKENTYFICSSRANMYIDSV